MTCSPKIGDEIINHHGLSIGNVTSIDGNICWTNDGKTTNSFIWQFKDGLNALHDWPGKSGKLAACPGIKP